MLNPTKCNQTIPKRGSNQAWVGWYTVVASKSAQARMCHPEWQQTQIQTWYSTSDPDVIHDQLNNMYYMTISNLFLSLTQNQIEE